GGIAWEYLFKFDGGRPPWVSGLAQGTALSALSRAAVRLGRSDYFEAARSALGIFKTPPPAGVRVDTPAGAHYLQYSFDPDLHTAPTLVVSPDQTLRAKQTGEVHFTLSKIATVSVTVTRRGRVVLAKTARLGYGGHALTVKPSAAGPEVIRLRAVDLAGNVGT